MAKKNKPQQFKSLNCLNCGFPFSGHETYCPNCGQKNKDHRISIGNFIREVFAGFFSWDAKFWRTLFPLLTRPGKVSKDYIEGKRVRYTNPFRFYLTSSIIFFLLAGAKQTYTDYKKLTATDAKASLERKEARTRKESLQKNIYKGIDSFTTATDSINNAKIDSTKVLKEQVENLKISFGNNDNIVQFIQFQKKNPHLTVDEALDSLKVEKTFSNLFWYSKSRTINKLISDDDEAEKFSKHFISYLSLIFLTLLPLFAVFLKLIYVRRKFNYIEHLIFSFHTQTVAFIILTLLVLASFFFTIKTTDILTIFSISFLVYLYIAMLNFYKQKWFKTFIKFIIVNTLFFLLFAVIFSAFSMVSFAFY